MKTSLDYKNGFLCVLAQYEVLHGRTHTLVDEWYPVRLADEEGITTLTGRPVTEVSADEGIYVDEEGSVYQLAEKGATKPIDVERSSGGNKEVENGQYEASRGNSRHADDAVNTCADGLSRNHCDKGSNDAGPKAKRKVRPLRRRSAETERVQTDVAAQPGQADVAPESITFAPLNLRQKLAVVRRRIAYVQKRGHNERHHYRYVTAADIAGAVGDLLAELGVVVVPRLESISHEAVRPGRTEAEHVARVVMSYSFVDVDTAEEITVKTAGEGLDSGHKAPYKAMTGALKYALLQSFLLATGDDPEDERTGPANHSSPSTRESGSERLITADEVREIRQLIEETGTELERVLDYYKLGTLEEMTEGVYRRAVEVLNRKRANQSRREASHAQG